MKRLVDEIALELNRTVDAKVKQNLHLFSETEAQYLILGLINFTKRKSVSYRNVKGELSSWILDKYVT
ncbi:hypothetical protein Cadr_000005349 [Camelus dromedarius]|uniref:Uncharacterized protein n=1 Tax=Camelus dromedarius TaxID=9838 RepID=A0A5N4E277_CAMDR|nr:hypothetical protein Cadr_000005349 [Camelus dromedarius]